MWTFPRERGLRLGLSKAAFLEESGLYLGLSKAACPRTGPGARPPTSLH